MRILQLAIILLLFLKSGYSQVTRDLDFTLLLTTAEQGELYKQSELGDKDFTITLTKVADKSKVEECKFLINKKEKNVNSDLLGKYDAAKQSYTIILTSLIANLEKSSTFKILKKNNDELYSFDIKVGEEGGPVELSITQFQLRMQEVFKEKIIPNAKKELGLHKRKGAYVDRRNVIHLFIDQYGKLYGQGIPSFATERNYFQIHILTTESDASKYNFSFDYVGEYRPTFNIYNTKEGIIPHSSGGKEINFEILDGAIKGPYTTEFSFTIKRYIGQKEDALIADAKINIPKLYHVSISAGLLATTLRNPQNIEEAELANGETTLIADDPSVRGVLTIMATYFPKGRSFLFTPSGGIFDPSRIGIQVGAQLNDKFSENFFLGLSHDFARGGSFSYGVHYGRRNYIPGKPNFKYGSDVYDLPELIVKKEWNAGFYFGVVIDFRVAIELLKSFGSAN